MSDWEFTVSKLKRVLVSVAVVAGVLPIVAVGPSASVHAAADLVSTKSAPGEVLAGEPIPYSITASNPGDEAMYNVSFRDVLAPGVTYVGPTSPASAGEPNIYTAQVEYPAGSGTVVDQQTLVWENVADLQGNDSLTLAFNALPDPDLYPVGAVVENTSTAHGSTAARYVPAFDADGAPAPIQPPGVESTLPSTVETDITAIQITKSEPSPEGELLRGVHDFVTIYTLRVDTTAMGPVDNVMVVDLLPAELEFLGCNTGDNSDTVTEEYPGSGPLGQGPTVSSCLEPVTVETVEIGGAVFTRVTWNLGDLAAGDPGDAEFEIQYAAGIPLRANALFAGGSEPSAESGQQGSNLDNNTGASTRELQGEGAVTNTVTATGVYGGALFPGASPNVSDDDELTRTIEDVRIIKFADAEAFSTGGTARYTIQIDTSEYTSASDIVVTDQMPNGMCPVGSSENYHPNDLPACEPVAGGDQDAPTIDGVPSDFADGTEWNDPNGGFTIVFEPIDVAAGSSATIQYSGRMLDQRNPGGPPSSGDSLTNTASSTATTDPILDSDGQPVDEGGTQNDIVDDSQWTLVTGVQAIDKTLRPRDAGLLPAPPNTECPIDDPSDYIDAVAADDELAELGFRRGDEICFRLRVDFDSLTDVRNPVVTDFLPPGTHFIPGSVREMPDHDVEFELLEPTEVLGPKIWNVGTPNATGRYVAAGAVFDIVFRAQVLDVQLSEHPIITGNLMKLRTENSDGQAQSYRDRVDVVILPPPPLELTKGVAEVEGPDATYDPPQDGVTVQEGSTVTYRIEVTNEGTAAEGNTITARALDVWDLLPVELACIDVVPGSISFDDDAAVDVDCFDVGDGGYPFTAPSTETRSVIRWDFPVDDDYAVAAADPGPATTLTLEYQVTIPSPMSVSQRLDNEAGVHEFATYTNVTDQVVEFYPEDNIGESELPADANRAPAADDPSHVVLPDAAVAKTGETDLTPTSTPTADPNNSVTAGVPGEGVTFTYHVDIPAHTTVFDGVLSDALPGQLQLFPPQPSPGWAFYPDSTSTTTGTPTDDDQFTLDGTGTLTFPDEYTNNTDLTQRFEVTLRVRVAPGYTGTDNQTNTATFTSNRQADDPSPVTQSDTHITPVIQPNPTLTKSNNSSPAGFADIGDVVQYTLTASNQASTPALYDVVLTDCIPLGLVFTPGQTGDDAPTAGPMPGTGTGDGGNGCAVGTTLISFDGGDLDTVAAGAPVTRRYSVTVSSAAVGGDHYTNSADLVGSSLPNGVNDPDVERVISRATTNTVSVPGATVFKDVQPELATIGEEVTYTIQVTAPRDVNLYNAAVLDTLPPGIDVDTLAIESVTCVPQPNLAVPAPPEDCPAPAGASLLTPAAAAPNTNVAIFFGDVLTEPYDRGYTIVLTARVADVTGVSHGVDVTNVVMTVWDSTNTPDPTTSDHDWDVEGDDDTATVTVTEPNVQIVKTVDDTTPEPGDTFTYSITVTNAGADRTAAYDLTIVDTVPDGVVIDEDTISPDTGVWVADATGTGGTITWSFDGPLCGTRIIGDDPCVGDTEIELGYEARLAPSATLADGDVLTNTAEVEHFEGLPPGEPDDNRREYDGPTDEATVTPDFPQLTTSKDDSGAPTYIGDEYTWTITTRNVGSGTAYEVAVTDDLPPNWTYVAGSAEVTRPAPAGTQQIDPTPSGPGCAADLCWNGLGELAPNAEITIVFRAVPTIDVVDDPGVGSTIDHVNTTSSTAEDATGSPGNESGPYGTPPATAETRIDAVDLVIEKHHGTNVPVAGETFDWYLDVRNDSATDTGVGPFTVTDTLPAGVTYVSATGTGWTCTPIGVPPTSISCTRTDGTDTIGPNGTFPRITVRVLIPADTIEGTTLANSATVDGRTYELDPSDNEDDDTVGVTTLADLTIDKTRTTDPIVAGRPLSYTLDVTNLGPSVSRATAADPIVVSDPLPAGTTYVGASGIGWACAEAASTITCERTTDLPVGPAPQITVTLDVASSATGSITNEAEVTPGPTTDPDPSNNDDEDTGPVTTSADLRIDKVSTTDPVPGETFVYRLRVDNDGPSDAVAVWITDDLPTGLTYQSSASVRGTWSCTPDATNTSFECDLTSGPLVDGDWAIVDITVFVADDVLGEIRNTAVTGSDTPDPNPGNNDDDDSSDFVGEADLTIDKSGPVTGIAGTAHAWTIQVTNNGPSQSVGTVDDPITVHDTLPNTVSFVSFAATGWTCAHDGSLVGGVVTCDFVGTLPGNPDTPSAAPPIVINVTILPTAGPDIIVNPANVTPGATDDPDPGNNDDEHPVIVGDLVDLTIAKSASPTLVNAGDTTDFTITVTNLGPSQADNVIVSDTLPAGTTIDAVAASAPWNCTFTVGGSSLSCSRPAMLPGSGPDIVVTARVDSSVPEGSTLVNTAVVATATPESDDTNNDDDATVGITADADLGIVKSHDTDPVFAGSHVVFDLVVTNYGPSDAVADVTVTDTLPPGFSYVSHTGPWECTADPVPADPATSQAVTCVFVDGDDPAPLAAGVTPDAIEMTVAIDPSVDPGASPYTNVAVVDSPTPDGNPDNDDDEDDVTVETSADLAIVKTHPAADVHVDDPVTFTIQVTNLGPSTAQDVVVTDTIPAGLEFDSVDAPGWTCVAAATITCTLDDPLPPGDAPPIEVTVNVLAAAYPSVVNTAEVDSSTPDDDPDNNRDDDTVIVPALVDLTIAKSHVDPVQVGGEIVYTLVVTNNGPTADPGPVTVNDVLPAGLTPVSAAGAGASCAIDGQRVSCAIAGPLAVGAASTITVRATVLPSAYPSVTNVATVSTDSEETTTTNNTATDVAEIAPLIRLAIDKSLASNTFDSATWTIVVTNLGPNDTIAPIEVRDELPTGLTYVSGGGDGWACAASGAVVVCTYAPVVAVGAAAPPLTIVSSITAAPGTTITNVASVSGGGQAGPDVSDNAEVIVTSNLLPRSGTNPGPVVALAAVLMLVGAALAIGGRRRTPTDSAPSTTT